MVETRRLSEPQSRPPPRVAHNRAIAPAPMPGNDQDEPSSPKKARSTLTRNACTRCRVAKAKCNGKHPTCVRCQVKGARCEYDVAQEGLTRMQGLQQKLDAKTQECDRAMVILHAFQDCSDDDAARILAQLRLRESIDDVAESLLSAQQPTSFRNDDGEVSPKFQQWRASMQSLPSTPLNPNMVPNLPIAASSQDNSSCPSLNVRYKNDWRPPQYPGSFEEEQEESVAPSSSTSATFSDDVYNQYPHISFNDVKWPNSFNATDPLLDTQSAGAAGNWYAWPHESVGQMPPPLAPLNVTPGLDRPQWPPNTGHAPRRGLQGVRRGGSEAGLPLNGI